MATFQQTSSMDLELRIVKQAQCDYGGYGCWLLLFVVTTTGCSSGDFGTVTGKVTADGNPLPNAMVTFFPQPDGRTSSGLTDENGEYELTYSRQQQGALKGEHMVRITTAIAEGEYGDKIAEEKIPAKYNLSSELTKEVKGGRNVIDFDLDLKGRIIQSGY